MQPKIHSDKSELSNKLNSDINSGSALRVSKAAMAYIFQQNQSAANNIAAAQKTTSLKQNPVLFRLAEEFDLSTISCKGSQKAAILGLRTHFEAGSVQFQFLLKILKSIDLSEDNCDFIGFEEGMQFNTLQKKLNCTTWILFGIAPHRLGLHIKVSENQLFKWSGCQIITGSSLDLLSTDQTRKKALWVSLKKLEW
ncbi:MAG: DNA polymerase III psi subunit [Limisphaerales bacterium]|jgi:DNA polymerase III psi subunit